MKIITIGIVDLVTKHLVTMQTMSESSKHTYLPHLEQRDWHFWSFFRSHKVHQSLLFNEALFTSRVTFIFLVEKIGATVSDFFVISHICFEY